MIKEVNLILSPQAGSDANIFLSQAAKSLAIQKKDITDYRILFKSIDARSKTPKINIRLELFIGEKSTIKLSDFEYRNVANKAEVVIVGAGPAGLFAALRLIELGMKPIILERGKNVKERKLDIAAINRKHIVDSDSNYCFGEGGAGTFSDGKLYTRSKKRGNVKRILEILNLHGAPEEILYEAHPHIGTDKLPRIITAIRQNIIDAGGEIHFKTRVTEIIIKDKTAVGVKTNDGIIFNAKAIILATGHSARDIYEMLQMQKIYFEPKAFAIGVRVEHPQELIDKIQYNNPAGRGDFLPAASYNFARQVDGRGVYSFCMCPGGNIVPAATSANELVVNGMSASLRNSMWANSGVVVEIKPEDYAANFGTEAMAAIKYQQWIENMAFLNGGRGQIAPAQCLQDFIDGKISRNLPDTSYFPGIIISPLHFWLPENIAQRLRKGFEQIGKVMRGFATNEAIVVGVESRTSSPVQITRNKESLEHIEIENLFPCGEGSGYAGGIVSSAIDGERCAEMICKKFSEFC